MSDRLLHLADTNVLLRLAKQDRPGYAMVRKALDVLQLQNIELAFTLQNATEFWNVSTRPVARNGFKMSIEECERSLSDIERGMIFLPDTEDVAIHWRRLVVEHRVSGIQVHEDRLATIMLAHRVTHILTFNIADFARFTGITAVHPSAVAA